MAEPALKERGGAASKTPPSGVARADYERDYFTWALWQASLLRAGRLDEIDVISIAEELEDLGRSEQSALYSTLRVLIMHMLKWDAQAEFRTRSWMFSIREQRRRYERLLKRNPGLISKRDEARDDAYSSARDWAANETRLSLSAFPEACSYTWDDILERPFEAEPAPE